MMRDKYYEFFLVDCCYCINDVLVNDKLECMMMRKEYEYNMNVLVFYF